ncbi:dienelactone hydrolase family protein [Robiginitalea sp.]|nr:dienelactone hydrolase family protein [Robiginitalea sp.]
MKVFWFKPSLKGILRGISFVFLVLLVSPFGWAQPKIELHTKKTITEETLDYYLYYPEGYHDIKDQLFPLLLFLHGGGESGLDHQTIEKLGPPKMLVEDLNVPMLILAPQNPHTMQWWNTRAVKQLLDAVIQSNRVDTSRIYITGLSRGGAACWEMAVHYPDTFAAMAVVCGMSPKPYAGWLNPEMGIWLFHGTADPIIPFEESQRMMNRLKQLGFSVTFTQYQGLGHEIWDRAYRTKNLFDWFLSHHLN